MADYDVIVLGAGHAGMMTATYLARAGLDVVILEKDLEVGGDMCTESFAYPGYWHNLHSYYHLGVDRLPPFRDLGFERFHADYVTPVSYTHLRAHETDSYLVCRLLLEKKK